MVVVLPAPFGPRKPVTRPGRTVKLSPSTAVTGPNRLRSWLDLDHGCAGGSGRGGGTLPAARYMMPPSGIWTRQAIAQAHLGR